MPDQEEQTQRFLKTNGPPDSAFKPDVPAYALIGASDKEKYLLEMASISAKQNEWLIKETTGLKGAHRIIHARLAGGEARFDKIEGTLKVFEDLRAKYLENKKTRRNVIVIVITVVLLPFLSGLAVEGIKHLFHWS